VSQRNTITADNVGTRGYGYEWGKNRTFQIPDVRRCVLCMRTKMTEGMEGCVGGGAGRTGVCKWGECDGDMRDERDRCSGGSDKIRDIEDMILTEKIEPYCARDVVFVCVWMRCVDDGRAKDARFRDLRRANGASINTTGVRSSCSSLERGWPGPCPQPKPNGGAVPMEMSEKNGLAPRRRRTARSGT